VMERVLAQLSTACRRVLQCCHRSSGAVAACFFCCRLPSLLRHVIAVFKRCRCMLLPLLSFPTPACHQGATLLSAQATRLFIPADLPKSLQEFG